MKFLAVIFVACLLQGALAQSPAYDGQCPQVDIPKEFDTEKFMGIWYGIEAIPVQGLLNRTCTYAKYIYNGNNSLTVIGGSVRTDTKNISTQTWPGKVIAPAQFAVKFNDQQSLDRPNYNYLAVVYDSWSCIYNCININDKQHIKLAWVITRTRNPAAADVEKARAVLAKNGIDLSLLETDPQQNCPVVE